MKTCRAMATQASPSKGQPSQKTRKGSEAEAPSQGLETITWGIEEQEKKSSLLLYVFGIYETRAMRS